MEDDRTIAITGMGAVTPLGVGARRLHDRWTAGVSGLEGGEGVCDEFEPGDWLSTKEIRRTDRVAQMAIAASEEAFGQAGWNGDAPCERERIACVIGTGTGGQQSLEAQYGVLSAKGRARV